MPSSSGSNGRMTPGPPASAAEWEASISSAVINGDAEPAELVVKGDGNCPGSLPNNPCIGPKAARADR